MKELSIEEKAKRYDEAIKKLCDFYRDYDTVSHLIDVKEELANLFPELVESEDEKVRKALIEMVHNTTGDELWIDYNVHKEDALAWLKKQGKEDLSIQQAYEWGYTEGKRIERKHWVEKQKFSEDYNSIDPQFGKPIEQNPAWSEEDEEMFEYTISLLNYNLGCRKWLKSLKERYFWKPKTWEIQILESVIEKGENPKNYSATLHSILEQLKKLKGE